jgi:hypothetical protein
MENIDNIRVEVQFYSMSQALEFLKSRDVDISDTWLRKRMIDEKLHIYRVGKTDFVTETDLYRIFLILTSKSSKKSKKIKRKINVSNQHQN